MVAYNKFNQFSEDLAKGVHNLSSNALTLMLTNTQPVATNSIKTNITEITAEHGYTAGGEALTITSCVQSSGTLKLILVDKTWTASGGSFGPFQWVVLYNDTPTSPADPLIGWWACSGSVTVSSGETFTVDFDPTAGALQIA